MESLGLHGIRAGETERESKALITLFSIILNLYIRVFNEHLLYKSQKD